MKENKTLEMLKNKLKKCGDALRNIKFKKKESAKTGKLKNADKTNRFMSAVKSAKFNKKEKKDDNKKLSEKVRSDKFTALLGKFSKKNADGKEEKKKSKLIKTASFAKIDEKVENVSENKKSENNITENKSGKFGKAIGSVKVVKNKGKDKNKNKYKIKPVKSNKLTNFIKFKKKDEGTEAVDKSENVVNSENNQTEPKQKKSFKTILVLLLKGIKQLFSRKSINGRILSLVVVSSVCIIALITVPTAMLIVNSIQTSVKSEISTMTDTYASQIELANDSLKESIETVGRMSQITDESMSVDERKAFLAGLCREMTFDKLTVAGITGATIDGDSIFSEEYFSYARMGQTYLTSPVYNSATGKNENIIAAQITNGKSAGVVVGAVNTDYFNDMIGGYKESTLHNGYCFIIDSEGKVISHFDSELISDYAQGMDVNETARYKRLIEKMINASEQEFLESSLNDGETYYISYAPIENDEKWCIATVVPKSAVNKEIISSLSMVILLGLLLLLVVVIVGTITARSISKPIIDLTGRVVALSEGDLKELVPYVDTKDETMQLYQAMKNTVKNLSTYVGEIDTVLSALANKNLCVNAKAEYHGDFSNIKTALEKFTEELNLVMSHIKVSSDQVAHGASEMSESATNLADGATEQNKALDIVMIEISDVAQLAKHNVEIAASTQACVSAMSDSVDESSAVMKKMVNAMNRLENSSNEIRGIVSVIENIMFQTNILALNASIEASKAGVHGRGFSVVAGEIRNLSENCSGVLKKITNLIKESIEDTQNGVELAGNVAEKLEALVENANRTTKAVVEIADASHKQAESVEKVKNGLDKIDSVVQSNSALAEETAAVSQELRLQANELMNTVSEFKIDEHAVKRSIMAKTKEEKNVNSEVSSDSIYETADAEDTSTIETAVEETVSIQETDVETTANDNVDVVDTDIEIQFADKEENDEPGFVDNSSQDKY